MRTWQTPYLGKPGNMRALPDLTDKFSAPPTLGESTTRLASGGVGVDHRLFDKVSYSLSYSWADPAEAGVLIGFYRRAYGNGPFVYVDPDATNVLDFDASACGVRSNAPHGWVAGSGTLSRTTDAPGEAPDSGVLTLTGPGANAMLRPGTMASGVDPAITPVYVPELPVAASLWMKADAATTATLQIAGYGTDGSFLASPLSKSINLGTSWQRFGVVASPYASMLAGAALILPRVLLANTPPGWVAVAGAQLEYNDEVTDWVWGSGARRVNITSSPGRDVQLLGYSDHTLTLAEV